MLASQRRTEQQNAIYKDMTAFMAVYPEVKQSLKIVLEQLVRERPADPLGFMALRLREINEDIKIERIQKEQAAVLIQSRARGMKTRGRMSSIKETKAEREEEERQAKAATNIQRIARGKHERRKRVAKKQQRKEQDQECPISSKVDLHGWPLTWIPVTQAAAKIQAIQRKKKDKARVEAIHKFNLVWLRELFFKLAGSKKAEAMVLAKLVDFFRGDQQAKDALNLPLRMFTMAPAKFQGMFKKLVWPSLEQELSGNPDKAVGWYEFAEMFRISQEEADKADVELAAVRIQAMSRQRKDSQRVKTLQRERQRLEGVEVRDDMTLGYTEDNQAIEGTGGV